MRRGTRGRLVAARKTPTRAWVRDTILGGGDLRHVRNLDTVCHKNFSQPQVLFFVGVELASIVANVLLEMKDLLLQGFDVHFFSLTVGPARRRMSAELGKTSACKMRARTSALDDSIPDDGSRPACCPA